MRGATLLRITDGAPGLVSALEQAFPESLHQRCAVVVARNLLEKVSKPDQRVVKHDYGAILNDIEAPPPGGRRCPWPRSANKVVENDRSQYPWAVDCLLLNLTALTAHVHFPVEHRERVRHTNLLEQTFGESRRRVNVIGRLPARTRACHLSGRYWIEPASADTPLSRL